VNSISHTAPRWWRIGLAACLVVAGCAGPGATGGQVQTPGQSSGTPTAAADGSAGGGGQASAGGGGLNSDAPIVVAFDGHQFGYSIGRCEVIDGVVYAQARGEAGFGILGFELELPDWDREQAHSRRDGRISAALSDGSVTYELVAGRNDAGTSWDWTISGSRVEVVAVMGNRTTATRSNGVESFTQTPRVTITMDCRGTFGQGFPSGEPTHKEFNLLNPPTDRVPGSVAIELEGSTYVITYLTSCQFFSDDVTAEGVSDEAYVYFYSEGRGVQLIFMIGDRRDGDLDKGWMLPPDVTRQADFRFEGSGISRTWSGEIISADGGSAEARITVECAAGDAFDPAGSGSVVLDGVTYVLDEVTSCTIGGGSIEFFGRVSGGKVAVLVTGGGSQIAFGDEAGQQALTRGVVFTVNGQQATWTGVLGRDRQATIAIDCG